MFLQFISISLVSGFNGTFLSFVDKFIKLIHIPLRVPHAVIRLDERHHVKSQSFISSNSIAIFFPRSARALVFGKIENTYIRMEKMHKLDLFAQCRLCGHYKIDFLDTNSRIDHVLSEKIFKCVGVRVSESLATFLDATSCRYFFLNNNFQIRRNDKLSKKLCQKCFNKINFVARFRKSCAAANIQMRNSLGFHDERDDQRIEDDIERSTAMQQDVFNESRTTNMSEEDHPSASNNSHAPIDPIDPDS